VLSNSSLDVQLHDTYYVSGIFIMSWVWEQFLRYLLGIIIGRLLARSIRRIYRAITFLDYILRSNLTFFPMHFLGFLECLEEYRLSLELWIVEFISSYGSVVTLTGLSYSSLFGTALDFVLKKNLYFQLKPKNIFLT